MGRLEGKLAIVTGAARRESIGRAIALCLAEEGADIAINDFRRDEEAEEVVAEIERLGRHAFVVMGDLTKPEECRRVVAQAAAGLGGLDILVNNAGYSHHQVLADITEADYDEMLDLNLKGPFFLAQSAVPHLVARGGGRIINISSEQAYIGDPGLPHYSAAKAGMMAMSKSLALALAPAITVNCVAPGPTATGRFRAGPEYTDENRERIPLKRWGGPRDVGRSVVFLASSDGDAFTGQVLDPNCGTVMP
ncbi:SDR family NAD(P)-dependent oxidoreductase [Terrihabitans rhizophilus]|uniref:SDR family oxidoreductase n=1 Tax=Terrihabitans rhizophilus TaxID=3092662 RepID=A0ABU4RJG6_9HYPH|nr:SDR family oxidoreductase [Terrihabitans sp. PJ23]MDX6804686.1 SDR family oxidoreductase [Terrihabitans sp. PJ23]